MSTTISLPRVRRRPALATAVFAATLFLSAFLLFSLQPMFTKMVLPLLGGTPAVWSVATVFFQAMLLAGYAYAHLLVRALPVRLAAPLHLGVMALAMSALPIARARGWDMPPDEGQALWLIGFFFVSIGLPFFAVSANGPLLQAWFARSGARGAANPYVLYGASNVGSFAALLTYPLAVEPFLSLPQQSAIWTVLFVGLAAAIALCAASVSRDAALLAPVSAAPRVDWRERLVWVALSAVPSGLLVSVTSHLSTDVAAVPLLWVVPLAIFLLTFVFAFREQAPLKTSALAAVQIWGAALALMNLEARSSLGLTLAIHLGLLGANALVCHRALYLRRPAPERLTDFYLTMSFGGVVGGVFAALAAPVLFSSIVEYPLLIVAALLCGPGVVPALRHAGRRDVVLPVAFALIVMALGWLIAGRFANPLHVRIGVVIVLAAGALATWRQPDRVVILLGATALAVVAYGSLLSPRQTFRSFFGVMKVGEMAGGQFRTLEHGTTLHGAMRIREADGTGLTGAVGPTTYYTPEGPLATAIASVREARGTLAHVSVVGLGVGAMACHMRPGEALTYYEIDPLVVRLASDVGLFRFLAQCAPQAQIVVGDARLTLAKARRASDILAIDAFSSDAIPAHLLTREAFSLYASKLSDHGVLLFHISNKYLDLRPLIATGAASLGFETFVREDDSTEPFEQRLRTSSVVAALVRDRRDLGPIADDARWVRVAADPQRQPWTDDYSNILAPILDQLKR